MNWLGNGWSFQNAYTGSYLGVQGNVSNGLPIVAVNSPFTWHIWRDDVNPNNFRWKSTFPLNIRRGSYLSFFLDRIFVPNTTQNLDLYNYGLNTSGDPIQLWSTWNGTHQTWNFTQGMTIVKTCSYSCILTNSLSSLSSLKIPPLLYNIVVLLNFYRQRHHPLRCFTTPFVVLPIPFVVVL